MDIPTLSTDVWPWGCPTLWDVWWGLIGAAGMGIPEGERVSLGMDEQHRDGWAPLGMDGCPPSQTPFAGGNRGVGEHICGTWEGGACSRSNCWQRGRKGVNVETKGVGGRKGEIGVGNGVEKGRRDKGAVPAEPSG